LFRHIKGEIDAARETMGRFLLTGSQSFLLMEGIADSLAGRCVWFEMENLSLAELSAAGILKREPKVDWLGLLARGQFPELWKSPDLPAEDFLSTYLATYLERDVRQVLNVVRLRDFERFMRILAGRSAQLLNKTEIAKDVGVSPKAVNDWISVLETSGQIALVEPWFRNFGKRIVKTPKLYFRDSGLLCRLLGLDAPSLARSPFLGAVWETFVFAELRKLAAVDPRRPRFWYYRDVQAREIDFVIETGGRLNFVEVKWTESPEPRDWATIDKISRELAASGAPEGNGRHWVVSRSLATGMLAPGIHAASPFEAKALLEPATSPWEGRT